MKTLERTQLLRYNSERTQFCKISFKIKTNTFPKNSNISEDPDLLACDVILFIEIIWRQFFQYQYGKKKIESKIAIINFPTDF